MNLRSARHHQILVVGDDAEGRLAHALRGQHLEVSAVRTIEDGLYALKAAPFDCAVLGVDLPRSARIAFRLALRTKPVARPTPVVTAKDSGETRTAAEILVARILGLVEGALVTRPTPPTRVPGRQRGPSSISVVAKTVLVVDDDPDMARAIVRTLGSLPIRAMTATKVAAAREILAAVEIDLVISDYSFGHGPTGLDLLAEIRTRHPQIRRLLLTGHALEEDELGGDRSAADRIVTKPWDEEVFVEACRDLLAPRV